jgi:hypothetical protein
VASHDPLASLHVDSSPHFRAQTLYIHAPGWHMSALARRLACIIEPAHVGLPCDTRTGQSILRDTTSVQLTSCNNHWLNREEHDSDRYWLHMRHPRPRLLAALLLWLPDVLGERGGVSLDAPDPVGSPTPG